MLLFLSEQTTRIFQQHILLRGRHHKRLQEEQKWRSCISDQWSTAWTDSVETARQFPEPISVFWFKITDCVGDNKGYRSSSQRISIFITLCKMGLGSWRMYRPNRFLRLLSKESRKILYAHIVILTRRKLMKTRNTVKTLSGSNSVEGV